MARRVLAWECKYCGAIKKTENVCLRHETACLKNPNSRNCLRCLHSYTNLSSNKVDCKKGKKCSQAVSAICEYFEEKHV